MEFFSTLCRFVAKYWNPVFTIAAFSLSVFDAFLHFRSYRREKESVVLRQVTERDIPAYSVPIQRGETLQNCIFFGVQAVNMSRTPVALYDFRLCGPGKSSAPASYFSEDPDHPESLRLLDTTSKRAKGFSIDLDRQNLALTPYLECNGVADGYLIFFGLPAVESGSKPYTLRFRSGNRKYKVKIIVSALPENLKPLQNTPTIRDILS